MKALMSTSIGGPETLIVQDVPEPVAGPGEVLVAVRAVGVNYPDTLIIEDRYQFKPQRPFAPGGEISGVIEALGPGVEGLRVGQRVLSVPGWGGMQEKLAIHASRVVPIPDAMPFDEAAAFVLTYGTTHYALKWRANLQPGETVWVPGASGGIGLSAIELARAMGARVFAGASSQDKLDLALAKGADGGLVYPNAPLDKAQARKLSDDIKALGGGGVDVVYDGVGGDYAEPALRALNWEGRFLVVGFPAGIPSIPLNLTLLKSCQIVGVFWGAWSARHPDQFAQSLRELLALYAAGSIRPHVTAHYPLERGGEAIAALASRKATGKLVVMVGS